MFVWSHGQPPTKWLSKQNRKNSRSSSRSTDLDRPQHQDHHSNDNDGDDATDSDDVDDGNNGTGAFARRTHDHNRLEMIRVGMRSVVVVRLWISSTSVTSSVVTNQGKVWGSGGGPFSHRHIAPAIPSTLLKTREQRHRYLCELLTSQLRVVARRLERSWRLKAVQDQSQASCNVLLPSYVTLALATRPCWLHSWGYKTDDLIDS